jgi:hypothetical protein
MTDRQPSNVRPIDPDRIRRIFGDQPLDYPTPFRFVPSAPIPPTFGERVVAFFRRQQFRIGMACFAVAVGTVCYFIFQTARGL